MRSWLSLMQQPVLDHLRDEGAGRNDDVVAARALRRDELRDHLLVRRERVERDLRAELVGEGLEDLRRVVVAPRVDRELVLQRAAGRARARASRPATRRRRGRRRRRPPRRSDRNRRRESSRTRMGAAARLARMRTGFCSAMEWSSRIGARVRVLGAGARASVRVRRSDGSAVGGSTKPAAEAASSAAKTCTASGTPRAPRRCRRWRAVARRGWGGARSRAIVAELHEVLHRLAQMRDADHATLARCWRRLSRPGRGQLDELGAHGGARRAARERRRSPAGRDAPEHVRRVDGCGIRRHACRRRSSADRRRPAT